MYEQREAERGKKKSFVTFPDVGQSFSEIIKKKEESYSIS